MSYVLFHMWEPYRKQIIASHNFYIEQAQIRLLSQFQNMEAEAEQYGEEWFHNQKQYFDPDRHDPASFYEQAHDESIGFYQLLEDMLSRTRLSVVAGIYHEWDKQLRSWISKEINRLHFGDEVKKAIWMANSEQIFGFLEALGFLVRSKSYYLSLNRCRLVVNAYKHGDGSAFESIKAQHPEFLNTYGISISLYLNYVDHTALKIQDIHINEFSGAILDFWNDVPEYIYEKESLKIPDWLAKAFNKDQRINL